MNHEQRIFTRVPVIMKMSIDFNSLISSEYFNYFFHNQEKKYSRNFKEFNENFKNGSFFYFLVAAAFKILKTLTLTLTGPASKVIK